jgi:hypothetical protein
MAVAADGHKLSMAVEVMDIGLTSTVATAAEGLDLIN